MSWCKGYSHSGGGGGGGGEREREREREREMEVNEYVGCRGVKVTHTLEEEE